jgi:hypothetical protein
LEKFWHTECEREHSASCVKPPHQQRWSLAFFSFLKAQKEKIIKRNKHLFFLFDPSLPQQILVGGGRAINAYFLNFFPFYYFSFCVKFFLSVLMVVVILPKIVMLVLVFKTERGGLLFAFKRYYFFSSFIR